jgi:EpsD family peptidyl-prolyl cis-trans isomerase
MTPASLTLAIAAALLLAGCGPKKQADATQVAARVNDSEITVHQLNYRLQFERGLRPELVDETSRRLLSVLVDQEVAVQKANELKLDQDPRVAQALDAARREVLARAYFDRVGAAVPAPTEDAIRSFYETHPDLFTQRRVYALTEIQLQWPGDKRAGLEAQLEAGKSVQEVAAWLKEQGLAFQGRPTALGAEALPLAALPTIAKLKPGAGVLILEGKTKATLLFVNNSSPAPVTFEQSRQAIMAYLTNEGRRRAMEANVQALRSSAKLEFKGKFEDMIKDEAELASTRSLDPKAMLPQASGVQITLPANSFPAEQVKLPDVTQQTGEKVNLPASGAQGGARVQVPAPAPTNR